MELETGHPICSLCRRELSNLSFELGLEAKLCEACRGLIQTALHGSTSVAAAASEHPSAAVAYAHSSDRPAASVEQESQAFFADLPALGDTSVLTNHSEFFNVNDGSFEMQFDEASLATIESEQRQSESGAFLAPVIESTEHHAEQHEEAFVETASSIDEMHFEHEPDSAPGSEQRTPAATVAELTERTEPAVFGSAPPAPGTQAELAADFSELHHSIADGQYSSDSSLIGSHLSNPSSPDLSVYREAVVQEQETSENVRSTAETAAADPWEEPLPAWDYSRNEYPVLMGPPRARSFSKYKVPFAVFLLLAFGAGFYYLIYPQLTRDQSEAIVAPSQPATETHAAKQKSEDAVAQSTPQSTPSEAPVSPASMDAKPTKQAGAQIGAPNEPASSQGRFALQAAAFPTQAGADEFAEKLKRVGVPSYVVAADLAHKGRWFRVRVGRFNTADEAQKFAAEAQLRAKAAGMSLQLMVSQYDQP